MNATDRLFNAARCGDVERVMAALRDGAEVDVKVDLYDRTPLHEAAWDGHVEVVTMLLDAGAKVNARSCFGNTPLHLAASEGHDEAVMALLAAGGKVNIKNRDGRTPLDIALQRGHAEVAALLVAAGRAE